MVRQLRRLAILTVAGTFLACDAATAPVAENDDDDDPVVVVGQVGVTVDVEGERSPISPFIYGSNQDRASDTWTVRRYGGNRLTGYNWENNFSNAGSDWQHSSDLFLLSDAGLPPGDASIPARAVTHFHDESLAMNAESIVTLQMAGWVAADDLGPVQESERAPSPRWVKVEPRRNAPFAPSPATDDSVVYMDELVHQLVSRYGDAQSARGVRWYSLDNEPALWAHTHPRIQPEPIGAADLVDRSIALAAAVKQTDPGAEIMGPALYGMTAYVSLQDAPDWGTAGAGYEWFIDYYLDRMRQAGQGAGKRLLDVLDVHWYPEAQGDSRITDANATSPSDNEARVQAPRTLWEDGYRENSWIGEWMGAWLPLLPRLQQSIDRYYPGTRLAITEYNYGGGNTISGGLAQADVLGIFGRYGVHIATLWGMGAGDSYTSAAFKLYRNYDGRGGTFGSTSVPASTSDVERMAAHAAIDGEDLSVLHIILLNRQDEGALEVSLTIRSPASYTSAEVWSFDAERPSITERSSVSGITGNTFDYVLPGMTAAHLILRE